MTVRAVGVVRAVRVVGVVISPRREAVCNYTRPKAEIK
jgi:hypothetical protein